MKPVQWTLVSLGWLSMLLGVIGAFLPILPTTPFMILAAFFFSKGSPRLHSWLLSRPAMGPAIQDWEQKGVIRRRAKILSTLMILLLFSYTLVFVQVGLAIKLTVAVIGVSVLLFIWSRPE